MSNTPPPARPRRRPPALVEKLLIRGIADGCTIDDLLSIRGATENALRSLLERHHLSVAEDGTVVAGDRDRHEWALVMAENSSVPKVRNRALRIRAAQAELDLQMDRERVYAGTQRRVALYRDRQIMALQTFRMTLRELVLEVDEEIGRMRRTSDDALAVEASAEAVERRGRVA